MFWNVLGLGLNSKARSNHISLGPEFLPFCFVIGGAGGRLLAAKNFEIMKLLSVEFWAC